MIKNRTEKRGLWSRKQNQKIRGKRDEKSKDTKKNKGVMEFVVSIMANPLSNRGALLSHSSPGPPYGRPRWTALTLTISKGWAITLYHLHFLWNMDLSWYKFNLLDRLCVRQSPKSKLFAFVNYRWILDLNYLMDNSLDSLLIFRVISLVGLQFHHFF